MGIKGILLMCYDTEVALAIVEPIPIYVVDFHVAFRSANDPLMHLFYNNLSVVVITSCGVTFSMIVPLEILHPVEVLIVDNGRVAFCYWYLLHDDCP